MKIKISTRQIAMSAIIAALYAAVTLFLFYNLSYGVAQFRVAEAMTILPFFAPAAVPGLFIGCFISNIISQYGPMDLIFGSLATLLAAYLTYKIGKSSIKGKELLAPLPPVVINAIVVGYTLSYASNLPIFITMLQIGLGQLLACYGLGLPLLYFIQKNKMLTRIFTGKRV